MIDTIKIFTMINYDTYNKIEYLSNIRTSYNNSTGEIHYKIVNDNILGSYQSSLCVRIGNGLKYKFTNNYYIEIERVIS